MLKTPFCMRKKKLIFLICLLLALTRQAMPELNLISARPKILSLRADRLNDRVIFTFAPEPDSKLRLKIFSLDGLSAVREIEYKFDGSGTIIWDGKSDGDYYVQPGIYLYQMEADGKIFSGTVVVAR